MNRLLLSLSILLPAALSAAPISYTGSFDPESQFGLTGTVQVVLDNNNLTVNVNASGLTAQNSSSLSAANMNALLGSFNYSQTYQVQNSAMYASGLSMSNVMPWQLASVQVAGTSIGTAQSGATAGFRMDLPDASAAVTLVAGPTVPSPVVASQSDLSIRSDVPVRDAVVVSPVEAAATPNPEPSVLSLMGLGLVGLSLFRKRSS